MTGVVRHEGAGSALSTDGPDAYNDGGTMNVNGAVVPPMTGI